MGMMQPKCRAAVTYCSSQEPASGREWMLGFPKRNGGNGFLNVSNKSRFGSASHFANIGSWKWCKHNSERTCRSGQFFIASWLLLHGNRPLQDATANGLGDRKPNDRIKTSLWQAWVWVAWIERGHQIWVQKIYGDKSFESITDSQLKHRPWRSSWTVTPNSIIHPYRLSDLFMNWMSLLERIAEINACNQLTCPINLLWAVRASLRTSAAERLARPTRCG